MTRLGAIRGSFRRLPLWVQLWVALVLVPVNLASLTLAGYPGGRLLAALAVGALLVNGAIMLAERGFSRAMALPHILLWTPLLGVILWMLHAFAGLPPPARAYLWALLAVDLVSLGFDLPDALKWWRGARGVA